MNLTEELEFALHLAGEAKLVILPYFQGDFTVEHKRDKTPVTIADRKAEEVIRERVHKRTPDYGMIGEEFGSEGEDRARCWVVDPIDGTKSFIHGVPLFGTLIALLEGGRPVVGVISLPALGPVLYAAKDLGCHVDGKPCRVSTVDRHEDSLLLCGSENTMETQGHEEAWKRLRRGAGLARGWGDCYGHFLVATGRAEAMVDPIVSLWDVAPLGVILPEAGGRFTSLKGEDSVHCNSGLSSNGLLHEQLVQELKS